MAFTQWLSCLYTENSGISLNARNHSRSAIYVTCGAGLIPDEESVSQLNSAEGLRSQHGAEQPGSVLAIGDLCIPVRKAGPARPRGRARARRRPE